MPKDTTKVLTRRTTGPMTETKKPNIPVGSVTGPNIQLQKFINILKTSPELADNIKSANKYFRLVYGDIYQGGRKLRGGVYEEGGLLDLEDLPDDELGGENALILATIDISTKGVILAKDYTTESGGKQIIGSTVKAGINFVYLLNSVFKFGLKLTRLPIAVTNSILGICYNFFDKLGDKVDNLSNWLEDPDVNKQIAQNMIDNPESILLVILGLNQAGLLPLVTIVSILLSSISFQLSPLGRITFVYELFMWYMKDAPTNRKYVITALMNMKSTPVQTNIPSNQTNYIEDFKNFIKQGYEKAFTSAKKVDNNLPQNPPPLNITDNISQVVQDPNLNIQAVADVALVSNIKEDITTLTESQLIKKLREYRDKQKRNEPITEEQITELNKISSGNYFIKGLIAKIQRENVNISQPTNTGVNTATTGPTSQTQQDVEMTTTERPKKGKGRRLTKRVKKQKRRQTRKH